MLDENVKIVSITNYNGSYEKFYLTTEPEEKLQKIFDEEIEKAFELKELEQKSGNKDFNLEQYVDNRLSSIYGIHQTTVKSFYIEAID